MWENNTFRLFCREKKNILYKAYALGVNNSETKPKLMASIQSRKLVDLAKDSTCLIH